MIFIPVQSTVREHRQLKILANSNLFPLFLAKREIAFEVLLSEGRLRGSLILGFANTCKILLLLSVGPYFLELCGKSFSKFKLINSNPHQGKLLFVSRESLIALFCLILFTDGLMSLLKQIGQGYVYLSSYECKQALSAFSSLATHHYNTGWVLTQVGRAHFELAEYRQV